MARVCARELGLKIGETPVHFSINDKRGSFVKPKAILEFTSIHYLVARVIVSLFAGLIVFVLNAVFNFRRV